MVMNARRRTALRVTLAAGAAYALSLGGTAIADHGCNGPVTQIDTPAGTFYIDDRRAEAGHVYVYQESNGEAGLQSGGSDITGVYQDTCHHDNPDTYIF